MFLRDLEEDPELRANVNIYKQDDQVESKDQDNTEEQKIEESKGEDQEAQSEGSDSIEGDMPEIKPNEILKEKDEV